MLWPVSVTAVNLSCKGERVWRASSTFTLPCIGGLGKWGVLRMQPRALWSL